MADISKRIKSPRRERGDYAAKTAAYSLKSSDSGSIFKWNSATSFNFNLPPVQKALKGVFFDFVIQTAATSGTGHGVSPAAVDKIFAPGVTATDDKDIYFATAATRWAMASASFPTAWMAGTSPSSTAPCRRKPNTR